MAQAYINNRMLTWARIRAALSISYVAGKMKKKPEVIEGWEDGSQSITFSEAQKFAELTHVPFGFLYLDKPLEEKLPIPDRRTVGSRDVDVSLELKDTLNDIMTKVDWYKDYAKENYFEPVELVGKFGATDNVHNIVQEIRNKLNVTIPPKKGKWEDLLFLLIKEIERNGVLVMKNGVVKNNTHRPIDVNDFRGFCLADKYSPVIFINNNDAKSAQLFTLIHELAHIMIGESGISDVSHATDSKQEILCNAVAAEYLVPERIFCDNWNNYDDWTENIPHLVNVFRVSRWVIARRALTLGFITEESYVSFVAKINDKSPGGGGSYPRTQKGRVSETFAKAVVTQALEGKILLREAQRLTGIRPSKLLEFAQKELGL
ncbi:ImmA/IrrE family metallo-endopeptidase [Serratia sp. JSRIV004]|uniref:ImmA/IrrE family metallo-endopeptidase n=1 Tax=Serratia sp. JSRIV004 TaxID=2831895 RepID=UPI001CC19BD7|nr:ImmA/IrrE family metallo-endopeptidase [Serratia sp. JSRIV004]UAN57979.1 ImmA/IrrE family metallo-endopeptidase [Serratia sp. JSRIV004]